MEQLITKTLDITLSFSFAFLYLGRIPEGHDKRDTYLLKVIIAASKKSFHQILASEASYKKKILYFSTSLLFYVGENKIGI